MDEFCSSSALCCRLQIHQDLREDLAKVKTLDGLADVSKQLKQRCQVVNIFQNSQENVQILSDVCTNKHKPVRVVDCVKKLLRYYFLFVSF